MGLTDSEELGAEEKQGFVPEGIQNAEETEEEVIEDYFEEVLDEWKSAKDFKLLTCLTRVLLAAFAAFSLASDCLLVVEYLTTGLKLAANRTHSTSTEHSKPLNNSTDQINIVYGIFTLIIQFLPGIQWYTSITTKHKLLRFLTTFFFPFFTVIFKVRVLMMIFLLSLFLGRRRFPSRTKDCKDRPQALHF